MQKDLYNDIKAVRAISSLTQSNSSSAIVSQIIDVQGAAGLTFLINWGNLTDADVTTVVLLEHSNDSGMSGAVAVPDEMLVGTELGAAAAFSDDNKVSKLGYLIGNYRYVRLTITPTANDSGALPVGVIALLHGLRKGPQSTQLA